MSDIRNEIRQSSPSSPLPRCFPIPDSASLVNLSRTGSPYHSSNADFSILYHNLLKNQDQAKTPTSKTSKLNLSHP